MVQKLPIPSPSNPQINLLLFILTFISVWLTGGLLSLESFDGSFSQETIKAILFDGWPFAVSIIAILGAHEMGHYLMGHVWKGIVLGGVLSIFIFYLVDKSSIWIINKSAGAFGFTKLYDIASLPLLILLLNVFMFIATPAVNTYTRYTETEADRFEIELTRDNEASASAMIKLHETSLVLPTPGVVYKLWNYDHPTFQDRVNFANSYKPWEQGKPIKYGKYIKN